MKKVDFQSVFEKIRLGGSSASFSSNLPHGPNLEVLSLSKSASGSLFVQVFDIEKDVEAKTLVEDVLKDNQFFVTPTQVPDNIPVLSKVRLVNVQKKIGREDRPYIVCDTVELVDSQLPSEHIHPTEPFLMVVPSCGSVGYETFPGLCLNTQRDQGGWSWKEHHRMIVTGMQGQWTSEEEILNKTFETIDFKLTTWADKCKQLPLSPDIGIWKAIMPVNPIGFVAQCRRNDRFSSLTQVALDVRHIRWEISEYLETRGIPVPSSSELIPKAQKSVHEDVVSVVQLKARPAPKMGKKWLFYALTSDPEKIKQENQLKNGIFDILAVLKDDQPTQSESKKAKK